MNLKLVTILMISTIVGTENPYKISNYSLTKLENPALVYSSSWSIDRTIKSIPIDQVFKVFNKTLPALIEKIKAIKITYRGKKNTTNVRGAEELISRIGSSKTITVKPPKAKVTNTTKVHGRTTVAKSAKAKSTTGTKTQRRTTARPKTVKKNPTGMKKSNVTTGVKPQKVTTGTKSNSIRTAMSCKERKVIIDHHNKLRLKVTKGQVSKQPKASNMQKMAWDDTLAKQAQNYSNKKIFEHNVNRKDERFNVGENLYMSMYSNPGNASNWISAIDAWFNEYKLYSYKKTVEDPRTGHYTQVIWANTIYVGCGFTYYKNGNMYNKLYVCNYGPAGNVIGQYPYKTGNGCKNLCCGKQCKQIYGKNC